MRIAICGTAASGKGTVARIIAARLNLTHIDAGLVFRTVALALKEGRIGHIRDLDFGPGSAWTYTWDGHRSNVLHEGSSIREVLISSDISDRTSRLASDPASLLALIEVVNRLIDTRDGIVVDGRSAGTLLAPDATATFYIDASIEVRARRRLQDLLPADPTQTFERVAAELQERDKRDRQRPLDPLRVPEGAVCIDTTTVSIDDAVSLVLEHLA